MSKVLEIKDLNFHYGEIHVRLRLFHNSDAIPYQ